MSYLANGTYVKHKIIEHMNINLNTTTVLDEPQKISNNIDQNSGSYTMDNNLTDLNNLQNISPEENPLMNMLGLAPEEKQGVPAEENPLMNMLGIAPEEIQKKEKSLFIGEEELTETDLKRLKKLLNI